MDKNRRIENSGWVDEQLALLEGEKDWQPDVQQAFQRFLEKRSETGGTWKRWGYMTTVTAAACLFIMILPSPKVLAHRCLECSVAAWQSLSGATTPKQNLKTASERKVAPDFELTDASGKDVKLSALKGQVVLVNFWATWCEGCQVEIPWFIEFAGKYRDQGLTVIGVSMDGDGWKSVRPWIAEKNVNYQIVLGNEGLGKKYECDSMPLTVLIDKDGKIADTHNGVVDKAQTEAKIQELLSESEQK
jgi:peroxiredoxin